MLEWINEALASQEFEDLLFFKIIMKNPDEVSIEEESNNKEEKEPVQRELVLEEEHYFDEM